MSDSIDAPDTVVHVFSKPSEEELLAAIRTDLLEKSPEHEWTTARVQIAGEAYSQIDTDRKPMHEVIASLIGRGLPADRAEYLVNCAADMQRQLAERDIPAPAKFEPIRWPEMIFWVFVIGTVIQFCAS